MIAARYLETAAHVRISACFNILNPGAVDSQGHLVFGFACSRTGMTSDTLALVDEKSVIWHEIIRQLAEVQLRS